MAGRYRPKIFRGVGNQEEPISVDSGSVIRSTINFNRELRGSAYVKLDKTSNENSKSYLDFESTYNNPGEFADHKNRHDTNHFSHLNLDISDDHIIDDNNYSGEKLGER